MKYLSKRAMREGRELSEEQLEANNRLLYVAEKSCNNSDILRYVKQLLRAGADPNYKNGRAIFKAVENSCVNFAKLLFENGGDAAANDSRLLELSVWAGKDKGKANMLRLLVEYGADVNAGKGRALETAIKYDRFDLVDVLLDLGADKDLLTEGERE